MEGIEKINSKTQKNSELIQELKKINAIQRSVTDMQTHIQFLLNREQQEDKKIKKVFGASVEAVGNKINNVSSHLKKSVKKKQKIKDQTLKNSHVREIRQRDLNNLEQTRRQISMFRQNQRNQVRAISKLNQEKIKSSRMQQEKINFHKAKQIRKTHEQKLKEENNKRQLERAKKQQMFMKQSSLRLNLKGDLQKQLYKLKEEQEQIKKRLENKMVLKEKIVFGRKKISVMDDCQVMKMAEDCKDVQNLQSLHHQNLIKIQKTMMKEAISKRIL